MPDRPWKDEYTLLCERCGYVLEGLDQSGNCPECGKPIAESLPERRIGTPWQQSPGVKSLLATWWMTLRHPLRTLDVMWTKSVDTERPLGWMTCFIASIILATGYILPEVYLRSPAMNYLNEQAQPYPRWDALAIVPAMTVLPLLVFPFLTWIETHGLIIIGKTRGFRIDKRLARTVTSHGCAGWLLLAILYFVLNNLGTLLIQLNMPQPIPRQYAELLPGYTPQWTYWVHRALWISGLLIGFLFFESFAYLGLRRCKYANRVRTESPSQGATTRREAAQ